MWTYFEQLVENLGQRMSGLYAMADTGRSLLYEALAEMKANVIARFTGDLQAVNAAVSGGADETYVVVLGKAVAAFTPSLAIVRNKFEVAAGAGFPVCSVRFVHTAADGSDPVALSNDVSLAGEDAYVEIPVSGIVPAGRLLGVIVTVPAAVTVALGFDLA